jgi:cullin-associated NEDD8-dissociated protein 1
MSSYVVANLLDKVIQLLRKLKSSDSDFRFMACTDLHSELQKASFVFDLQSEQKLIEGLVKALLDSNSEVQNMAIKW